MVWILILVSVIAKIFWQADISWWTIVLASAIQSQRDKDYSAIDNALRRNYGEFMRFKEEKEMNE